MRSDRLEAFSDGVLAIIITIMVLELKVPHAPTLDALVDIWPVFLSYILSFLYVGIYWNNHHHMFQLTERVDGAVLWSNLHLLFWLSLLPFSTGWMGENHFSRLPVTVYGLNLLLCAVAYYILQSRIIGVQGRHGRMAAAIGRDVKGRLSPFLYLAGMIAGWCVLPSLGVAFYVLVAMMWLVPDRRIERELAD